MLSIYATLSSCLLAVRESEREAVNMQGTVFALARLKIVPSIELVSYPMPEHDELNSLVRIKLQQLFPDSY